MPKARALGLLLLSALALPAQAAKDWRGEGDLAYSQVSGNSDAESLLAALELELARGRFEHRGRLEAVRASEDGSRTAESYALKERSRYRLDDYRYGFAGTRLERNRFSGYEHQATVRAGFGWIPLAGGATRLELEAGPGWRTSEEQGTGDRLHEVLAIASAALRHHWSETTTFEVQMDVESGRDNTYLEGVAGLAVRVDGNLSLKVTYSAKHNTDVPPDTVRTDTLLAVGLNYAF